MQKIWLLKVFQLLKVSQMLQEDVDAKVVIVTNNDDDGGRVLLRWALKLNALEMKLLTVVFAISGKIERNQIYAW